ncbi:MAG: DUF3164 family protein [Sphingobacteriales bacterium]|nr:DUF3164 family protein [Sphingobacteriales bacterium]
MRELINQQKSADGIWRDETGTAIPYNRTTKYERLAERKTAQLAKQAASINASLTAFKTAIKLEAEELYETFIEENNGKVPGKGKGNFICYNFDRTIKVEVSVSEPIKFDENFIVLAKAKIDEVVNDNLGDAKEWVREFVNDAFSSRNGGLDTKKVLSLRRYADKVNDARYNEAMSLIDKSIRKPESKEYFRVWVKDESGKYVDIQLNFSSIK